MNIQDRKEFKELIKEGTLEVLQSDQAKRAIREGTIDALESEEGKTAIIETLKTQAAKEVFLDNFTEAFHDVVVPVIERLHEEHEKRLQEVETKVGMRT